MHTALTIAGSDSGGGAGIQADLKTFEAHGVFGTSAITALTAQNTRGVEAVWPVPVEMVRAQLKAITSDFTVGAAKTGMLFDEAIIQVVAEELTHADFPLVVDPVSVSTSGHSLLKPEAVDALKTLILPLATLITPNIPEAELLTGITIASRETMIEAAEQLSTAYPGVNVLLKGFHLTDTETDLDQISDLLLISGASEGDRIHWFTASRIDTPNTHGTGCTLSAAIAANLATGNTLKAAVAAAKTFTHQTIQHSWANLGKGPGTLRHNFNLILNHEASR